MFDPAVVRYGQQPNPDYEAKHEGSPNAPYVTRKGLAVGHATRTHRYP
ncbi:hypothetical protein [Moorena sp. SIO3B2]|nr:hypothetical protein [Moorena sp. SIO3B2]